MGVRCSCTGRVQGAVGVMSRRSHVRGVTRQGMGTRIRQLAALEGGGGHRCSEVGRVAGGHPVSSCMERTRARYMHQHSDQCGSRHCQMKRAWSKMSRAMVEPKRCSGQPPYRAQAACCRATTPPACPLCHRSNTQHTRASLPRGRAKQGRQGESALQQQAMPGQAAGVCQPAGTRRRRCSVHRCNEVARPLLPIRTAIHGLPGQQDAPLLAL